MSDLETRFFKKIHRSSFFRKKFFFCILIIFFFKKMASNLKQSTSLARQLNELKLPQTSSHKERFGSVSFLYDFFQAKTIDIDTHYSNAIISLENLIQIDDHFRSYKQTLFHESSKKFDRSIENKETNDEIDKQIDEFLFYISKYFQLTDSHKVIEYMIQRYRINEYNVKSLIGSVLPYHETRIFVRLIQTCSEIKNPKNRHFYWMKKFQENGVPITKSNLFKHCVSDMEFTHYVTDSIFKCLQYDQNNSLFPSFLLSFCLNLMQRSTEDMIVSHILSVISRCIRHENQQLFTVALMIFSHLCNLVQLEISIVQTILKSFFQKNFTISQSTLIAFEIIIKCQNMLILPKYFIKQDFIENLISLGTDIKLKHLPRVIILNILMQKDSKKFDQQTYKNYIHILLETFTNSDDTVKSIVSWMNDCDDDIEDNSLSYQFICHTTKLLEKMYPDYFDLAISSIPTIKNLSKYLKSIRYSLAGNSRTPLYLGVEHSSEKIRHQSLLYLAKNFNNLIENIDPADMKFIRTILLKNLTKQDFDQKEKLTILLKIFKVKEKIFNILTEEEFESIVLEQIRLIQKQLSDPNVENDVDLNKSFIKLKQLLIEIYCSKSYGIYCRNLPASDYLRRLFNDEMQQTIILCLLSTDLQLSTLILSSEYAKTNPLFQILIEQNKNFISIDDFTKLQEEEQQMEQLKLFAQNILNGIALFLNQNQQNLFPKSNILQSLSSNSSVRFKFLFLYSMIKMLENHSIDCGEQQAQIICQFIMDLFLHLLSIGIKISSRSEVKIVSVKQYDEINMDDYFLFEFYNFNNQSLSLLIIGYILYRLMQQKSLVNDDLPSTADWYLTDVLNNQINYDFYYKIYCLLIYYSTPNESKSIKKKTLNFFRYLFSLFIMEKIQNHQAGLKFFLPSIVNHDSSIQQQTLLILNNLFGYSQTSEILINSIGLNSQYLIAYLLALNSSKTSTRQMAIENLKRIVKNEKLADDLKLFIQKIIDEKQLILSDMNAIALLLGRLQNSNDYPIVNELLQTIIFILTAKHSTIKSFHKVALLKLLLYCNQQIKSIIFEFYTDFLSMTNRFIDSDEELQLNEIINYYDYKIFDTSNDLFVENKENASLKFLIKCIECSGSILTENISTKIFRLITPERFQMILNENVEFALKLVQTLLKTQLSLSEKSPSSTFNYGHLINSMEQQLLTLTFDESFAIQMMNFLLPINDVYETITTIEQPTKRMRMTDSNRKQSQTKWKLFRIYISSLAHQQTFSNINGELIRIMFDYLKLTFMDIDDNFSELTRQSLLYAITNIIELKLAKKNDQERMDVDGDETTATTTSLAEFMDYINVDIIIDCITESRVKETQRISLLLISMIAPYFRKQIIEYLVTIFTFIGSNLLECDDQYSLSILFETMESIIPIIIANNDDNVDKSKSSKSENMKQFISSVFIKSFSDIPAYRRLQLFTKLITLLGADHHLPLITVYLMEKISSMKSETEKETGFSFLQTLFQQFDYDIQLRSVCILLCLFETKFLHSHFRNSFQKKIQSKNNTLFSTAIIRQQQQRQNPEQFQSLITLIKSICKEFKTTIIYDGEKLACGLEILKFIRNLISTTEFVYGIRKLDYEQISSIPLIYFINITFELIVLINPGCDGLRSSLQIYRKRFKSILDEIFLQYNALVPNAKLLDIVLYDLLNNTAQMEAFVSILIKRKALELLNKKLDKLGPNDMNLETTMKIFETLYDHLKIYQENLKHLDDNQLYNVQLILLSMKLLTKFINNDDLSKDISTAIDEILTQVLIKIIEIIRLINNQQQDSTDNNDDKQISKSLQNLRTSSILCLSQILSTLSTKSIVHLSDVIELILKIFNTKDEIVIISNVSSLHKIILNFGPFLSPHLKSIIIHVLPLFSLSFDNNSNDLRTKLNKLWLSIAKLVPKRIVFEAIDSSYELAITESSESVIHLMNLFKYSCDFIEKSDMEIILKNLKNFMLKSLSFRSEKYDKVDVSMIERIETSFCEAFAAFIPKLTETNFRPIYYSLLDWSIKTDHLQIPESDGHHFKLPDTCYQRIISFYRFCSFLADRLKSLFCIFVAPNIIKNCNQILIGYHSPETNDSDTTMSTTTTSTTNQEPQLKIDDPKVGEPLVQAVLSTLSKCFLYDLNGTFVNKNCISSIFKPIVNQISNLYGNDDDYQKRLDLILQCTQYLIQNNRDETLIKDFNYQILLKSQESNVKVKISAIKVLHRLVLTCDEDYLPFIPEAMPFIADLSEDDSEQIELHLKQLITDIEQLIGEPINKYL
ncbi:HEAT repeat containing 1 homolog l(2)k09022 [Dermatophagoides pteronyssinus]|uniref:HEAT repeat containing 1 homolog l(2)k09022 n=1 Tax=Dermatophagoides pteronyssinus TaxID=6956 RepID=UPI003F6668F9